jgi:hypothetical protein
MKQSEFTTRVETCPNMMAAIDTSPTMGSRLGKYVDAESVHDDWQCGECLSLPCNVDLILISSHRAIQSSACHAQNCGTIQGP